jgi:hypothetical protein
VPILWSGNDVTLWPGESVTLTARYRAPAGAAPTVRLEGWNVAGVTVPTRVAIGHPAGITRAAQRLAGLGAPHPAAIAVGINRAWLPWRIVQQCGADGDAPFQD